MRILACKKMIFLLLQAFSGEKGGFYCGDYIFKIIFFEFICKST